MRASVTEEVIDMTELQVETTLAFVTCIAAAILVSNAIVNKSKAPKSFLAWSSGACFVSGTYCALFY